MFRILFDKLFWVYLKFVLILWICTEGADAKRGPFYSGVQNLSLLSMTYFFLSWRYLKAGWYGFFFFFSESIIWLFCVFFCYVYCKWIKSTTSFSCCWKNGTNLHVCWNCMVWVCPMHPNLIVQTLICLISLSRSKYTNGY